MSFDLIIKNGRILDGTGSPWIYADIGVKSEKIIKISSSIEPNISNTIDANGLWVSPGWIDIHMHADHTILGNTRCESYIHQGVTTVTMGNCGLSMYPIYNDYKEELIAYLKPFTSGIHLEWNWVTLSDFLSLIEQKGAGINIVPFVGHGSIRINTMGFQDRAPTDSELETMQKHLADAMKQGAFGMSTGLGYPPGTFTKENELIYLCKTLVEYGGLYSTHMKGNLENLQDTIRLGYKTGIPIQISHLGSSCGSQKTLSGKHRQTTLVYIDQARENGLDITADIYPYTAGSSLLSQIIPDWAHEGGVQKMLGRLKDPGIRKRLKEEYADSSPDQKSRDFSKVIVTYVKSEVNKKYEGFTVTEIAESRGVSEVDALLDLLIEENAEAMNVTIWGIEEDVSTLVQHPAVMPCSDGWSHAPYGPLGDGKPHPRSYGAFPRYIRKYVKEQHLFTLEESIRRMTSMPAQRLGLQDRGLLREGMKADITIFDFKKLIDKATFKDPHQYPEGIEYVVVNGEIIIGQQEHTGKLAGKVLRKKV